MPNPWENYADPAAAPVSGPWANYSAPPVEPGALSRAGTSFREGLGVPADAVQTFLPGAKYAAEHPGEALQQTVTGPIEGYKAAVTEQHQRMTDAYSRGDYGQAVLHGLYYLLAPVGGAQLGKATEQAVKGDVAGSLGTTAAAALPAAVGSPEIRANVAAGTSTARAAVATGLEKSAGPVSTIATIAGAGHELLSGRLESAAITATLGKTAIGKTMTKLADFIKPGENAMPMPISHAAIQNAIKFLKSPGMEGEAATAEATPAAATDRGTFAADPRTHEQILQAVRENMAGGQGKVAMQEGMPGPTSAAPVTNTGFGTAKIPIEEQAQAVYEKAAAKELPAKAPAQDIASKAAELKARDQQTAALIDDAIRQLKTKELYGKTPTKSNLKANLRQMASPTGSTAPVPAPSFFSLGSMKQYLGAK